MDNQTNTPDSDSTTQGRNANDNFNEEKVDDYGVDKNDSNAEEELEERSEIKGGTGSRGEGRNRNDDFAEEGK